jgi:hypothetical protein
MDIVINEIAWAGTDNSSSDEWIELFNNTDQDILLETKGYITKEADHKMKSANISNLLIVKTKRYNGDWEDIKKDNNILKMKIDDFENLSG